MKYDIYFHGGCFDGAASAAVLLYFLRKRGDGYRNYKPQLYPVNEKKWRAMKLRYPSIIVDYLYHPRAAIWFDHHPTTFIDKRWEKNFRPDEWHCIVAPYPSSTGLLVRHLQKHFGFKPPAHLRELAYWLDIIDSAGFSSSRQLYNFKLPAIQIMTALDYEAKQKLSLSFYKKLIGDLSRYPLKRVAKMTRIRKNCKTYYKLFRKSLPVFKKSMVLRKNTVILDASAPNLVGARFIGFHYHPKAEYGIRIIKSGNNFSLGIGENPWHRPRKKRHIGRFLRKTFGSSSGGHQYVGAARFRTKSEALQAIEKILKFLNG